MSKEEETFNDEVTLTLEDDTELVCDVLATFDANVNNETRTYIALLPKNAGPDDNVFIYRFTEKGDDIELGYIDDEEEFEIAADAYDEYIDNIEFDEMLGEDEE